MPRIFRVENRSPLEASTFLPLFISLPEFAAGSKDQVARGRKGVSVCRDVCGIDTESESVRVESRLWTEACPNGIPVPERARAYFCATMETPRAGPCRCLVELAGHEGDRARVSCRLLLVFSCAAVLVATTMCGCVFRPLAMCTQADDHAATSGPPRVTAVLANLSTQPLRSVLSSGGVEG